MRLTKEGNIVLGPEVPSEHWEGTKTDLDRLHLRKIDLSHEVLIVDMDSEIPDGPNTGYIGPSTQNEIAYAKEHDVPVIILSSL